MLHPSSESRSTSPVPLVRTPVHRVSRRLRGLSPEFGLQPQESAPMATTTAARSDSAPFIPASFVSLQNPRIPKPFHGGYSEDAQDWLDQFERVARFNGWDDSAKIRNVYFSLEDAARIWYENRETSLTTWQDFRRQLLETYTSSDRREQAERELTARIQLPNENVAFSYQTRT